MKGFVALATLREGWMARLSNRGLGLFALAAIFMAIFGPQPPPSEEWPTVKCLLAGMLPSWRPTKPHLKDINQHCQHSICGRKDFNQKNNSDHFDNQQRADLDIA